MDKYKFASSSTALDGVTALTLVDISDGMLKEAKAKCSFLNVPSYIELSFIKADATSQLSQLFGEQHFDTVVDTFSLCVMGTNGAKDCLRQMRNVVKCKDKGGLIFLIENTRANNQLLGKYQDVTADFAAKLGGKGCVYNQDVKYLIQSIDGLNIVSQNSFAAGLFTSFVCIRD